MVALVRFVMSRGLHSQVSLVYVMVPVMRFDKVYEAIVRQIDLFREIDWLVEYICARYMVVEHNMLNLQLEGQQYVFPRVRITVPTDD